MSPNLRPIKRLGQNFLTDANIARKIVASVRAPRSARIVEIGPGTGALTGLLLEAFEDVVAIEVDARAVSLLSGRYPDADVRQGDVLQLDWRRLAAERGDEARLYVIGNLPYYITSQILFSILEAREVMREAVVMMQLEVAERLVAPPGSKTYGIMSVILQHYSTIELLFRVSRNVFYPRPDVQSAVVRMTFEREDPSGVPYHLFREVTRTAFNQRRKTLRNSLSRLLEKHGAALPDRWAGARAEELTPEDFVSLTRLIERGERGA